MRYVKPYYYDKFQCIADKCPDTCCAGWQIVIDDESLERYAESRDAFGVRLQNSVDWQEGCFLQYHGRCAMLNEQNLCDLVIEKGEEWLCDTCDRYPRHIEEFDGVREMSLSLSCPVAAEMMLQSEEPVRFLIEEDEVADPLEDEFEDFDFLLFTQLEDARGILFSIVQNRKISIELRMAAIMKFARKMQECVDEERLFDMDDVLKQYAESQYTQERNTERRPLEEVSSSEIPSGEKRFLRLKESFGIFHKLEHLREDWTEVITGTEKALYAGGYDQYSHIYDDFYSQFVAGIGEKKWEIFPEQILMFFLYTYFCGAVYDDCIYSKVAMAVFSACYIQEFIMGGWYLADKQFSIQECTRLAYRYAREVEHSDENLNLLEEWLMEKM
ncbi:MAG: flagellin lysine-N-methylase [Lachnospiraceae bacterium]